MQIFEKLPQILGLCPIVKVLSDPRKIGPPIGPPSNEKSCNHYCRKLGICLKPCIRGFALKNLQLNLQIDCHSYSINIPSSILRDLCSIISLL